MNHSRIQEVFSDELFVQQLLQMDTAEEVQNALKAKGVELSIQEIHQIRDTLVNNPRLDELSDDQLAQVAGGFITPEMFEIIKLVIKGISTGIKAVTTVQTVSGGRW